MCLRPVPVFGNRDRNYNPMPTRYCLLVLLATLLPSSPLTAAVVPAKPAAAITDREWIVVSGAFMASRFAVVPGTETRQHRVIVDLPRGATADHPRAKVTRSSGHAAFDAMALDFVRAAVLHDKKLATNAGKYTLGSAHNTF